MRVTGVHVEFIVIGNFVTMPVSEAQSKWYTKVISKISSEGYRLGVHSGCIMQNRITGSCACSS